MQRSNSGGQGMPFAMSLGSGDLGDYQPQRSTELLHGGGGGDGSAWTSPTLDNSNDFINSNGQLQDGSFGVLQVPPPALIVLAGGLKKNSRDRVSRRLSEGVYAWCYVCWLLLPHPHASHTF